MKKLFSLLLSFCVLVSILNVSVFANSAPVYTQPIDNIEVYSLDGNSNIQVLSEYLTFDFSNPNTLSNNLTGVITADYLMQNTQKESVSTSMVFPFIVNPRTFIDNDFSPIITVDGNYIDYKLTFTDFDVDYTDDNSEHLNVANILNSLNLANQPIQKTITEYTLSFTQPINKEVLDVEVLYSLGAGGRIITDYSVNSYSGYEDYDSFSSRIDSGDKNQIKFYVYGDIEIIDIVAQIKRDTNDEYTTLDNFNYTLENKDMDIKEVYDIALNLYNFSSEEHPEFYNILDSSLFTSLDFAETQLVPIHDLPIVLLNDTLAVISYDVEFNGNSTQNMIIKYIANAGYDNFNFNKAVYPVTYLLEPAIHWKNFSDLNISIITNEETPYIINSSLDFTKSGDFTYTYSSETLPNENLSFALASIENQADTSSFHYEVIALIIIAILSVFGYVIFNKKKKKN